MKVAICAPTLGEARALAAAHPALVPLVIGDDIDASTFDQVLVAVGPGERPPEAWMRRVATGTRVRLSEVVAPLTVRLAVRKRQRRRARRRRERR